MASLKNVHPNGKTTATSFLDSRALLWPGWETLSPRDVPSGLGLEFYIDVVRVSKAVAGWEFPVKLFASEEALKTSYGTYRFPLAVTADNAEPAFCEIDVTCDGDWHNLKAIQIS